MGIEAASPVVRGGLLALLAATLFGLSTPFVQLAGRGLGPFTTACLLYAGAAVAAWFMRRPQTQEARLRRSDAPRLAAMAFFGAIVGPVALAWGLQHTSGTSASLLLALEAVFTALLAWKLYGETLDRRVWLAMTALLLGGLVLALEQGFQGTVRLLGLGAVLLATLAWGLDNALSRGVADRDPGQVVLAKAAMGVVATLSLACVLAEPRPGPANAAALLAIGASGYGLSLRVYLLAQRSFGAARTGSVFAFAPFLGALAAYGLGERQGTWLLLAGGSLMLLGVLIHLLERHDHEHVHARLVHEHAHTHDDGHHDHVHDPMPTGPHSHRHEHRPMRHSHPHVPDIHHLHRH